ncbi:DUF669 domain-containing protein [Methylobacterium planeticum]|uniref:DUF669 domain-containing protein n=1 Tax=Methylobacterium planeticum TaxID=2615211 RepID=A0A6N6MJ84_9HYPH|nr:DUF669 domain-containing protein [Methylobacterium planeticum]KAB1068883.1 DUF669 domain-containing protein [Methylobacterium planeticum]
MAYLGNTFDPNEVPEDERSFEPMPEGDYNVQIVESEIAPTKSGGDMLKLTLEVIDGQFANRKVWDNLNIRNSNAVAQGIAQRALADICAATNTGPITDSEELHFKPFVATLKIEPSRTVGDRTYDARNGVKRYKARGGQPPAGKSAPAQRTAAASLPPAQRSARPWGNGAAGAARPAAGEPPF